MRLSELTGSNDRASRIEVAGITADSRAVLPGYVFAALRGVRTDGTQFISDAIEHGAVAVLAPSGTKIQNDGVFVVSDENPRRRLALMAARFYPRQPETIVAVTGTNGKTSTADFAAQIWARLGITGGSLGTLGLRTSVGASEGNLTTPDPVTLHRSLDQLAGDGIEHLAMEASSHGLDQYRLDGVRVSAAAFTNISHDHLDYHGSHEAYLAAKLRLFTEVMPEGGIAVLNADLPEFETVRAACANRRQLILTYGTSRAADYRLVAAEPGPCGQTVEVAIHGAIHKVLLPLYGSFQAENALAALALVVGTGANSAAAVDALGHLQGVTGRAQLVAELNTRAKIFVDYAHTPDALSHVLTALRPHTKGRLVLVFGCGGERDRAKRPEMGRIASELADHVIVTDDNPRDEDAATIRGEILAACPGAEDVGSRSRAIARGIAVLAPGDLLVVAGKGHETGQVVRGEVRPFDDTAVIRKAVLGHGRNGS
ncbi:MAG: UDP-N-acetylmuramoyl-L-alanyl-D-glutamate--2,6-diaminopimelate ligase [Proteobacteria bacterium]|nr:UDP-N-acetylmuramoyl-L-alanyl-D-glutamate--2,6-diaminopimelate ligase [Pseudomonadota bacterium]MDA1057621.1 UDP-N-acetylmuramoyl-L-alanyl-D-glutamate--2,6-diaminopimelate ligase [Pseudomonadota bacterium]